MITKLLVCDLDNTLYDWFAYFVPAFYAMVDEVVRIAGCDRDMLLSDFREVHQEHHDAEHPFSVLETATVRSVFAGCSRAEIARRLDPAFYAFNSARKEKLKLYPGVQETLKAVQASDVRLVAHTEGKLYAVIDRLTRLNLTDYFERIYCRERSVSTHPDPQVAQKLLEEFPMKRVVELSHRQRKPDPTVLLEICQDHGVSPNETAYVGDSIARDIMMAKMAGVIGIWAKYGAEHSPEEYEKLVRISHWTAEDVAREKKLKERAAGIEPDYVLEHEFSEILYVLNVSPRHDARAAG